MSMQREDQPGVYFNGLAQIEKAQKLGIKLIEGGSAMSQLGGLMSLHDAGFLRGTPFDKLARWGAADGRLKGNVAIVKITPALTCDIPAGTAVFQAVKAAGEQEAHPIFKGSVFESARSGATEVTLKADHGYGSKTKKCLLSKAADNALTFQIVSSEDSASGDEESEGSAGAVALGGASCNTSVHVLSFVPWFLTCGRGVDARLVSSPVPDGVNLWHCLGNCPSGVNRQHAVCVGLCIRAAALKMKDVADICSVDLSSVEFEYDLTARLYEWNGVELDKKSRFSWFRCRVCLFADRSFVISREVRKKIIAEAKSYTSVAARIDPAQVAGERGMEILVKASPNILGRLVNLKHSTHSIKATRKRVRGYLGDEESKRQCAHVSVTAMSARRTAFLHDVERVGLLRNPAMLHLLRRAALRARGEAAGRSFVPKESVKSPGDVAKALCYHLGVPVTDRVAASSPLDTTDGVMDQHGSDFMSADDASLRLEYAIKGGPESDAASAQAGASAQSGEVDLTIKTQTLSKENEALKAENEKLRMAIGTSTVGPFTEKTIRAMDKTKLTAMSKALGCFTGSSSRALGLGHVKDGVLVDGTKGKKNEDMRSMLLHFMSR